MLLGNNATVHLEIIKMLGASVAVMFSLIPTGQDTSAERPQFYASKSIEMYIEHLLTSERLVSLEFWRSDSIASSL